MPPLPLPVRRLCCQPSEVTIDPFMSTVMAGHGVNHAANRVAAVKKRRRTFDNLDSLNSQHIDRFCVIARLKTKSSDPVAILQNQNAIAIKASNYRSRGSRAETPL